MKLFACPKCNRCFDKESKLKRHEQRKTPCVKVICKDKETSCIYCNTSFYSFYTLGMRKPEIRLRFVEFYGGLRKTLVSEIEHARTNNIIKVDASEEVAKVMISMIEGTNFYQHVSPEYESRNQRSLFIKSTLRKFFSTVSA